MKNIVNDIKNNNYKQVYLIYGEEKYLVKNIKNNLIKGLNPDGDTMNFTKFVGDSIDELEVISTSDTMPFFADRRVILIEDSGWLKSANDKIAEYLKNIPEYTIFIFVEDEIDKRNKVYKQISSLGYVCECARAKQGDLISWVAKRIAMDNKKITKENAIYFIEKVGDDMNTIASELEKVIYYAIDRDVIEKTDIDAVCITEITGKIFEMIDAIGRKEQKKALDLYYDLIATREAPMKILYMLSRQFNIMYQIKEMEKEGFSAANIAKNMGMQNFIVNKALSQCKNFKLITLKNAINYCVKLEEAIKLGNMDDTMAVELVIVRYSKV